MYPQLDFTGLPEFICVLMVLAIIGVASMGWFVGSFIFHHVAIGIH